MDERCFSGGTMSSKASFYENDLPEYAKRVTSTKLTSAINSSPNEPETFIPIFHLNLPSSCKEVADIGFSNGGDRYLVSLAGGAQVTLHDVVTGQFVHSYQLYPEGKDISRCYSSLQPDAAAALGIFYDDCTPIILVGTKHGHIYAYDLRHPMDSEPSLVLEKAHNGPISALHGGLPYNTNYLFSTGKTDGWIREFDLRFPYHQNIPSQTAAPIQAVRVSQSPTFHTANEANGAHRPHKSRKTYGISSMDVSLDGRCMAVSNDEGDCVLYSLSDYPIRSMKRWVLGDFSAFHRLRFTRNSKYVLCCSTNSQNGHEAAHLWNAIQCNRSICMKSPGDGAPIYQGHFLLEEGDSNETKNNENECKVSYQWPVDTFSSPVSTLNYCEHAKREEATTPASSVSLPSSRKKSSDFSENYESLKPRKLSSIRFYTPESSYLEKKHRAFWHQYSSNWVMEDINLQVSALSLYSENAPQSFPATPKRLFQNLPPQHAAHYINCGILNPSFGRTDLFDVKFVCEPWREFVVGIGGNHLYGGFHIWDAETGVCLSTASFPEASADMIQCISASGKHNEGLIATGGTTPKTTGCITLWKNVAVRDIVNLAIQGKIRMHVDLESDIF